MPTFTFFERHPVFDMGLGATTGGTVTIPEDIYDDVGTVVTAGNDDAYLEDFDHVSGNNGRDEDADITLSDGTFIDNTGINLEATWTLEWTDQFGATQSVLIGHFEYGPSDGNQTSGIIANGPLPPAGTEVTIAAYDSLPNNDDVDAIAYTDITTEIACFAAGTRIQTRRGEIAVEDLRAGDLVRTMDDGWQPIRWIGSAKVAAQGAFAPVVITAGALGNSRDLIVSPCHRVLLTGWRAQAIFDQKEVLVTARQLAGRDDIYVREGGEVEYYHILFDRHQIIFAEGAATESFLPSAKTLDPMSEQVRDEIFALFPELAVDGAGFAPARRALADFEAGLLAG
ncbi:Hint domain-containing protein [Algicella marina]|uniref:Type I secretion protein n=1 Tax=Algicella marina TaxID=2683284 RepID=A0A6P1SW74_9RHOB|nr:Hint domain-containing protein [Algicella marina]QHQ34698.1 type I secretion protein [Algicella marina]